MAIVKMKRLRLVGLRQERRELLRRLQRMGCVEISEVQADPSDPEWAQLQPSDTSALTRAQERVGLGERALTVLKRYAPTKGTSRPVWTQQELTDPAQAEQGEQTVKAVLDAQHRLEQLQAQQVKLQEQRQALAPWLTLDIPLDTASTGQVTVQRGTLPVSVPVDEAREQLLEETELAQLHHISSGAGLHYLLLLCHNSVYQPVFAKLNELGWVNVPHHDRSITAREEDTRISREQADLAGQIEQTRQRLKELGDARMQVQQAVDRAAVDADREAGASRLLSTRSAFFLQGWVPEDSAQQVGRAVQGLACAVSLSDPDPADYDSVPVKLKNNWFTRPLNMVTQMYVYPAYDGLDPNPLMAPFFIVFFGLMMADMAYGLLMLLGGWYLLKQRRAKGTMAHMAGLLVLCGGSAFVFGALTGSFLGDFIPQLTKLIDPDNPVQLPYLFTPLTHTLAILVGSLALGALQIITGMAISVVYQCRNGAWADALWNEITWWVVLAGAALAVLGVGSVAGYPAVLFVGLAMLVYGSTRKAKGFGKVTALVGAVYNGVSGFFSDILSYARLMALMLAGAVIAQVFNTLGSVTGNVVGFLVISLTGNALNLALNLLGCYVHDLRLQCLEFFGRFYKEGGRPFAPMAYNTKYADIIKEEH